MTGRATVGPSSIPLAFGLLLIALGALELAFRAFGIDVIGGIADRGWPLFVIVPGLVLLALSIVPEPPKGAGFAIAGSIVTTIGGLLLYQSSTGDWESWAYLWAAIPLAAGTAMTVYGLATATRGLIRGGLTLATIAGLLLVLGTWLFRGLIVGDRFVGMDGGWPIFVIGIGVVLLLAAWLPRGSIGEGRTPPA